MYKILCLKYSHVGCDGFQRTKMSVVMQFYKRTKNKEKISLRKNTSDEFTNYNKQDVITVTSKRLAVKCNFSYFL